MLVERVKASYDLLLPVINPQCACARVTVVYPAHAARAGYMCDRGCCPFMYVHVCIYVSDHPKSLNGTLAVDELFQTLVVDFLSN